MANKILITGSSGLVARFLIKILLKKNYIIYAASSNVLATKKLYKDDENLIILSNEEVFDNKIIKKVNFIVHCAFTRKNDMTEIVKSLDLTYKLLKFWNEENSNIGFINISTRSVYAEPNENELNTETSIIKPSGYIGLAKYASELMTDLASNSKKYTSLRLSSVNELKNDNNMVRPMNVFVENMIERENINIVSGNQIMSYIDPRDVADAIYRLLLIDPKKWKPVYNIGTGWLCTKKLLEIANLVVKIGKENFNLLPVKIIIEEKDLQMHAGLDISRLEKDTGWKPSYTLENMISDLYLMYLKGEDND